MAGRNNGLVAGLETTFPIAMLMSAFLSVALYSVIELTFLTFFKFKSWRGLYFWSLVVATWGIAFNSVGYILKFFQVTKLNFFSVTMIITGWTCMVTGQSLVLYSRLHLVLHNHVKVRSVLVLIISNVFICHVPVIVLVYGVNSSNPHPWIKPYKVYECVQLTIFALQEVLISGLYIYYTVKILGPAIELRGRKRRAVMMHLIYVNAFLIVLDVAVVGLQYAGLYEIQTSFKPAVYAVKLKLEFHILNHLLLVTQKNPNQVSKQNHHSRHLGTTATVETGKNKKDEGQSYPSFGTVDAISLVEMQSGVMRTTEVIVKRESADDVVEKVSRSSSQAELAQAAFPVARL